MTNDTIEKIDENKVEVLEKVEETADPRVPFRVLVSFDDVRPMQGHIDLLATSKEHAREIAMKQMGMRANFLIADIYSASEIKELPDQVISSEGPLPTNETIN